MNIIFWTGVFEMGTLYRAIGAYQMAWWMRKHGFDCQVIDFVHHMTTDELVNFTKKFINNDTICIGLSSTFWSSLTPVNKTWPMMRTKDNDVPDMVRNAIIQIKQQYPHIKFVLGGHTADFIPIESYKLFDVSIVGEAEDSFLELVTAWKTDKRIFHSVTRGGRPFINAKPNLTFDISTSSHRFIDQDCILPGESLPLEISRGCIFKCTFCQYPHTGKTKFDYLRQFDVIGQEIEHNYNQFGTSNYYLLDDTFNDSDFKMQGWNNIVKQLDHSINYTAYLRADLLSRNQDHIELLKQSGLLSGFFGIESFHPEASRLVGKGWSGKEAKIFLPKLKQQWGNDVTFHCSFIVGLPPEKTSDYFDTLSWLINNKIDSWVFKPLLITPGFRVLSSEFDRNYEKYGFEYNEVDRSWKTPYMTDKTAVTLGTLLNHKSRGHTKVTSWRALSFLSHGISKTDLNTRLASDLDWALIRSKQAEFIALYKTKLSSL